MASVPIEEQTPDYSILEHIDYTYPVHDAYFGYASRGCIRKCHFCGVPKLEGTQREMPSLASLVRGIADKHGEKKDLILMDNNVTASSRYREIIAEIRDLGFTPGATLTRDDKPVKRRVDFNQGVDARILAKSPMYLKEMATICISPLRIAFDHIGVRKVYETSVRMAADNGITSLSNYMLYNFMDTPAGFVRAAGIEHKAERRTGHPYLVFPYALPAGYIERSVARRATLEPLLPAHIPDYSASHQRSGQWKPRFFSTRFWKKQRGIHASLKLSVGHDIPSGVF